MPSQFYNFCSQWEALWQGSIIGACCVSLFLPIFFTDNVLRYITFYICVGQIVTFNDGTIYLRPQSLPDRLESKAPKYPDRRYEKKKEDVDYLAAS